ncbi:MAG TPA: hypothetical protein VGO00_08620 [Kofleriaceae bacterium]|nr:hypothetical protein [Kofleriaceae bacterium]
MAQEEQAEHEFLGKHKDKMWTYLILMFLLVAIVVVVNVVWKDPDRARDGVKNFFGLPGWALATVAFLIGAVIFWLGLKVETDWPEAMGAFLIAGSIAAFEFIAGWSRFEMGFIVVPYLIPLAVFVLLLMYGMRKSV